MAAVPTPEMSVTGKTYASSLRLSASGNSISRRDSLTLAAAGLAAPLLPTFSFAETRKETNPMSYIKVGQENSTPSRSITRTTAPDRRSCSSMAGR